MAFIQRFSTIERGGIRFIGNTLGLSKLANANSAGTLGSIGAFTTLANTQVSNFPAGTTFIPDSVFIDNVQSPGADPAVGVNIGTLNPTEFKSIAYNVTIN